MGRSSTGRGNKKEEKVSMVDDIFQIDMYSIGPNGICVPCQGVFLQIRHPMSKPGNG